MLYTRAGIVALQSSFRVVWRYLWIGILLAALLVMVWRIEVFYDTARINSGPSTWYIVFTSGTRSRYTGYGVQDQTVIGEGYPTERLCDDALAALIAQNGTYRPLTCRRLLVSDAAKMKNE